MTIDIAKLRNQAERGLVPSQVILGVYLLEGREDVAVDYGEALRWLSAAAEEGASRALYHLGRMYLFGFGVESDIARARELLSNAAMRGEFLACVELGRFEASRQNVDGALRWYGLAVEKKERVDPCNALDEALLFLAQHANEPYSPTD